MPRRSIHPEFLLVRAPSYPGRKIGVLVNGDRQGTTDVVIRMPPGRGVRVGLDLPDRPQRTVDVVDTDLDEPLVVEF